MKFLLMFFLLTLLISGAFAVQDQSLLAPADSPADRIILPDDPIVMSSAPIISGDGDNHPRRDPIIGERYQAGDTWYDYQTNGTVGKMIGVDPDGNVHVTWMDAYDQAVNNRHQKYNCYIDGEWIERDGVQVDDEAKSGYGCLWMTEEEEPRAMIFCHAGEADDFLSYCYIDIEPCIGAFIGASLPRYADHSTYWPKGVMSANGLIHTITNRSDARMVSYSFGTIDRMGEPVFDEDSPSPVAETHLNCFMIARSAVSDRVAITWMHPRVGNPAPERWDGFLAYQLNNDLYMVVSEDGEEWDFDSPINVTDCIPPQLDYNHP
ncbi:MAG: hypothetical protein P9M15_06840, partial [Candidatus Electryoneaceae bacterium]|nr:hypothetical protein [Candidatus Electryoneaceae bacterium]